MKKITGIAASKGIVIAKALKLMPLNSAVLKCSIDDSEKECKKLELAFSKAKSDLQTLTQKTLENCGKEEAAIFEAHELLLDDPEIRQRAESQIRAEKVNASYVIELISSEFASVFDQMDDEYLKARAADIRDVYSRVVDHLEQRVRQDLSLLNEEVILIAHDLTPSQTASINKEKTKGFLTNIGGKTSHSAIMARTMEIAAVVGLKSITESVEDGDLIAFNGESGEVIIHPTDEVIKEYKIKLENEKTEKQSLQLLKGQKSQTLDGHRIELAGNIGTIADLQSLKVNDAEAVGLYRTEFLFMDRKTMPTEEEQYQSYKDIVEALEGKECLIRTLDIGGDKRLDYLDIGDEENPFLGFRAIRICLKRIDFFKIQLRAILRASAYGPIGIMFPMISSLRELLEAKAILEEAKSELRAKEIKYSDKIKIGLMIEVPSAALISDVLADHVDFFSLGTNDLTQYALAVDRMNESVEELYDPFNPGLLRLINLVAENAKKKGVKLAMCGSIAHRHELLPLWIGMGFDELSMSPVHILLTRQVLRSLNLQKCQQMVSGMLKLGSSKEVKDYLKIKK